MVPLNVQDNARDHTRVDLLVAEASTFLLALQSSAWLPPDDFGDEAEDGVEAGQNRLECSRLEECSCLPQAFSKTAP